MANFDDAKSLIEYSRIKLDEIKTIYETSLSQQNIEPRLLIEIKSFMEHLRSALDYSANTIFTLYGSSKNSSPNTYFPYAQLSVDEAIFIKQKRIEQCIPGIGSNRPDIVEKIISYQHFRNKHNKWLPIFMDLNNENKHNRLIPQKRKEKKSLEIRSGGSGLILEGSAKVNVLGTLVIGCNQIKGPQIISVESLAQSNAPLEQTITVWTSFHFENNDEEVIPLLENSLNGINKIVDELSKM